MKLYTKQGVLKYKTDCAPNNGYFLIPLYDKVNKQTFFLLKRRELFINDWDYY